eukprot:Phypoly_transcript_03778.p1 GENE.Phypoly_transcript_03778~~Phypoly_transcript_03778.p1  ORF type:complete len:708 (+),score=107.83 Phypoly_transcript_03778:154-2277(+)
MVRSGMSFTCILIYFILYLSQTLAFTCIHDVLLQFNDSYHGVVAHQKYNKTQPHTQQATNLLQDTAQGAQGALGSAQHTDYPNENNTFPIRFYLDLTFIDEDPGLSCYYPGQVVRVNSDDYLCKDDDVLSAEREEYIRRTLVPAARDKLTSMFKVIPVDGPLYLASGRCGFQGGVQIPQSYTKSGVGLFEVDLVVFVTTRPVTTPHVLAFAGECQEDQIGRAIAGHLNINPKEIDVRPYAHEGQLGIVLHELTHVMGFSFGKFSNFHSPDYRTGYAYVESKALAHGQTETIAVINTPRVQEWVQNHFGCDTLPGAPLENGGGSGTKLSHWEKRTFMNEYMTGEATHNPVLSGLTLAMFQDSGWYVVNFSHSEPLMWGKGRGCDFFEKSCAEWPREGGYHCTADGDSSCTFDLLAKGNCNTNSFDEALPLGNQYFSSPKKGGMDSLSDYCPYIVESTGWCDDEENNAVPALLDSGELFCPQCRCFTSSLIKDFPFGGSKRLSCYKMECAGASDMRVRVGKLWYECPPNTSISVEGYSGHLYCPSLIQIRSICANASTEGFPIWPFVSSVSPTSGAPGEQVTILGTGFSENVTAIIHKECTNVTVVNSTMILATLPDWDQMGNPAHIVSERVNVVVMDRQGRTGVGTRMFLLHVSDDPKFYIHAMVWLVGHWLTFVAIFGAIGAAYYVRAARRRELQFHLQRSNSYVQQ